MTMHRPENHRRFCPFCKADRLHRDIDIIEPECPVQAAWLAEHMEYLQLVNHDREKKSPSASL